MTKRELDLMVVLWDLGGGTVEQVRGRISKPLAYTTVLATLRTMARKGLVRQDADGKAHRFVPLVGREDAVTQAVQELAARFFHDSLAELSSHLIEKTALRRKEIRRIRKALKARLKSLG